MRASRLVNNPRHLHCRTRLLQTLEALQKPRQEIKLPGCVPGWVHDISSVADSPIYMLKKLVSAAEKALGMTSKKLSFCCLLPGATGSVQTIAHGVTQSAHTYTYTAGKNEQEEQQEQESEDLTQPPPPP